MSTVDPEIRRGIEAILMVAEDPVHPHLLAQLVDIEPTELDDVVAELDAAYTAEGRGFVIARVAGGFRFQSHPDAAPYVERFVLEGQTARLSSAALETLAIVAYKQPISRAQVASIRGVSVDGVVRTLEQRGYIAGVARDPGPGNAILFGTTPLFLEKLGLDSVADLPPIAQFVPDAGIVEQLEHGLRARPPEPDPDERTPDAEPDEDADRMAGEDASEDDADPRSDEDPTSGASEASEVGGASGEAPADEAPADEGPADERAQEDAAEVPGDHQRADAGSEGSDSDERGGAADPAGPGPR
jgi:segregation and condensation protein B